MESAKKTPAHGGVPEIRFSTDDMPAQGRIAAWQEIFGRHILNVDLTPLRDEPLQSNVVAHGLPGLGLVTISHENVGFRATRTRELVSRGSEDIILTIVTNGALGFSQMGREAVANAGEAVAVASAYTGEAITVTPAMSASITFGVPRSVLAATVRDVEAACVRVLPAEPVALLKHYAAAVQYPSMLATQELQHVFVTHIHDLIALALGATQDGIEIAGGRGLPAARLRAVKDDIFANLQRPDLSLDALAKRQGISPRYIRMLFAAEATSFSDFVRAQRLARAHRMLRSPQYSALAISTIAYNAGFGDLSHFNHAFRRAYGATPSDVRTAAQQVHGVTPR